MLKGGCFCGWIRYEAAGTPFHETSCHCSICRRTTGAPFVTWFSVPRPGFRLVRGEPDHTHAGSRLGWIRLADRLPQHPERRS
jgi:hypothetical protein